MGGLHENDAQPGNTDLWYSFDERYTLYHMRFGIPLFYFIYYV